MKCVLPSVNFKVLGKAIMTLSRIGDELYVNPERDCLHFSTMNSDRSGYATVNFYQSFFSYYSLHTSNEDHGFTRASTSSNGKVHARCKVAMKSILAIFRTPSNNVEMCQLIVDPEGGQLEIQLRCRHSTRKTFYVPTYECGCLQAEYNKETSTIRFSAQSRVLCEVMQNFQRTLSEITLTVSPNCIIFRNYLMSADSRRATVRSEVCLQPLEFESLTVQGETTVTFNLMELRALLLFAEATSLPVAAHFATPGRPVVFTINSLPSFEAIFVLATVPEELHDVNSQASTSNQSIASSTMSSSRKRHSNVLNAGDVAEKIIANQSTDIDPVDNQQEMEAAEQNMDVTFATQKETRETTIDQSLTPPWLKAQRFFYPRCFMDSQRSSSPENIEVLCPDSDPEDAF